MLVKLDHFLKCRDEHTKMFETTTQMRFLGISFLNITLEILLAT